MDLSEIKIVYNFQKIKIGKKSDNTSLLIQSFNNLEFECSILEDIYVLKNYTILAETNIALRNAIKEIVNKYTGER